MNNQAHISISYLVIITVTAFVKNLCNFDHHRFSLYLFHQCAFLVNFYLLLHYKTISRLIAVLCCIIKHKKNLWIFCLILLYNLGAAAYQVTGFSHHLQLMRYGHPTWWGLNDTFFFILSAEREWLCNMLCVCRINPCRSFFFFFCSSIDSTHSSPRFSCSCNFQLQKTESWI